MALRSTVFKCDLKVSDLDRNHFQDHALVLARHPSETDERMMVRLLAYALNASEGLVFGDGLSSPEEPALSEVSLDGRLRHWIDVGLPDTKNLRRAAGRADRVTVYAYGRTSRMWWDKVAAELQRVPTIGVCLLAHEDTEALARCAQRNMVAHCLVQDGAIQFDFDGASVNVAMDVCQRGQA